MISWRQLAVAALVILGVLAGCRTVESPHTMNAQIERLEAQVAVLSNTVDRISTSVQTLEHHLIGIEQFNKMVDEIRYAPIVDEQLLTVPEKATNSAPNDRINHPK
ncbi:MAG: hypothetical protein A2498_13150 [Lentisphaerae bacterium RIFOXYC12_FULL_60_16]|nr:MAG: hypothetical protein A2498_13150 [Lentisphaerae bacterium RIFOXYC12_FULL_60_16]OGV82133.1 MAG: hypothetical protein A2340_02390 [Lentisphaerae bacterium RIFOXYB12_FULL_60_10]